MNKEKENAVQLIQRKFRETLRQKRFSLLVDLPKKESSSCLREPIRIGDENVYMCLKRNEEGKSIEYPLFNMFNYSPQELGIKDPGFFSSFYYTLFNVFGDSYVHTFYLRKSGPGEIEISVVVNLRYHKEDEEEFIEKYIPLLEQYFYPYLLYIFANNKIDLAVCFENDETANFKIEMFHPTATADPASGIHKDNTIRTCLTYVNSPVSTELAFDLESVQLDWLTCSPLFRFDTSEKLYTLCFNDVFIHHTKPIYEEEGTLPEDLQLFEPGHTMTERDGFLDFGDPDEPEHTFIKQAFRTKVGKPPRRELVSCFIENVDEVPETTIQKVFPFDMLKNFKIIYEEEKIELSETQVHTIITTPTLGKLRAKGGKKSKKRRKYTKSAGKSRKN